MAFQEPQFPHLNINTERVVMDKYYFGATGRVSSLVLNELKAQHRDHPFRQAVIEEHLSPVYDELVIYIKSWLLKSQHVEKKTTTVRVPHGWWDHAKHDMLLSTKRWIVWLARKLDPPQYDTIVQEEVHETRVCPHNDTYFSENSQHITWMLWRNDPNAYRLG